MHPVDANIGLGSNGVNSINCCQTLNLGDIFGWTGCVFRKLCEKIENDVGEAAFKSDKFLELLPTSHVHKKLKEATHAHFHSTADLFAEK